jgi:WD40 repeat protein
MSYLSVQQVRSLFETLTSQYEYLSENRAKLEQDCNKLKEYIDAQVQQIQSLNADFEKLRQEYVQRRGEIGARQPMDSEMMISGPQQREVAAPPPAEETPEQDWEVIRLQPAEKIEKPVLITLLAEIVDVSVICSTAFSPDGTCLAIGSDKTLRIYNIDKDDFLFQYNLEDGDDQSTNHIRSIAWTNDSKTVLCGGEDGKVRVFTLPEQKLTTAFEAGKGEVFQVCISNNNEFFATVSGDGVLGLFRLADYFLLAQLKRESEGSIVSTSVAISSDDKLIAVGYGDCNVALWDVENRKQLSTKVAHANGVYAVKFVPDKQRLVSASLDATVKIWDIRSDASGVPSLELVKSLEEHTSFVLSLAVDKTGEWLLSGSKDLTAILSSISSGTMIYSVKAHTNSVITVAFSPHGNMFCTGSGDQSVKIWSISAEETEEGR